jgi:hypothetical protein
VNSELEGASKEELVVYFEMPSRHLPEGTEENHKKNQSNESKAPLRFKANTFWI